MDASPEITQIINLYFDTLYYCDLDKFDRVFHKKAIYATADEAPLLFHNMTEYRKIIAERVSPASTNELRKDFIDNIKLAGKNTAIVSVRCTIAQSNFIDFLTLVREDGQWRVIAKVFHIINDRD